jgi:ABC-type ATPase involved in cell division
VAVIDRAFFEIFEGDSIGLWGLRRSGKSTLLRILAGIELPDSGSLLLDDVELTTLTPDRRVRLLRDEVGLASFGWSAHRNRTVCEHVALAASADYRVSGRRARILAGRALRRVDVADCAERALDRLSLGEHIRVELARAMVRGPRLLLIDDPPAVQSLSENAELHKLLRSFSTERGRTVLIASCELEPINGAERMMALGRGELRMMDNPGTVLPFPDRTGTGGP